MTIANDKKENGLPIHNAYHRYAFLNDKKKNNDGSGVINLLIQGRKRKDYKCKKANHGVEMISKKRLKKGDDGLVVKID